MRGRGNEVVREKNVTRQRGNEREVMISWSGVLTIFLRSYILAVKKR